MSYKVQLSKTSDQQTITIRKTDLTDISSLTTVTAKVYTSDLATPINEYSFSAQDLTDIKAGSVSIDSTTLLSQTSDEFYQVILDGDTIDSESANVGITLEAQGKVLNNQGYIDVYSSDYRTDKVLHVAAMLAWEMNAIENQEASYQKRVDFTTRLEILKNMLNYE
jgi:hypothetical protein